MIALFTGPNFYLSNFAPSPVCVAGVTFPTAEHAFQAMKASSPVEVEAILNCPTPSAAKGLGRRLRLPPGWDSMRGYAMRLVVSAKFFQNPDLAEKLVATGNERLVEGNAWHDQYWGDCICVAHVNTPGQNQLGLTLERVRAELWRTNPGAYR